MNYIMDHIEECCHNEHFDWDEYEGLCDEASRFDDNDNDVSDYWKDLSEMYGE